MSKHPVDIYVGKRVRHRRWMVAMSQQQLAEKVGIKFQQIQKYEKGTNRIGASRLQHISTVLKAPVSFFFEDLPEGENTTVADINVLATRSPGAMKLLQVFNSLDAQGQQGLLRIAETIDNLRAPNERVLEAA